MAGELEPIKREYGGVTILVWPDGSMNATAMCKANGKEWSEYWRNAATQEYVKALSDSLGIPRESLVESKGGRGGGTRVHKLVAWHLAQWCSAKFAVQVAQWIDQLVTTGRVDLRPPTTPSSCGR